MKGVVIYKDNIEAVRKMDDETAGKVFKAIFEYMNDETLPSGDPMVEMLFEFFRVGIDYSKGKHAEISRKRSQAGRKGGKQTQAKRSKSSELELEIEKENKFGGIDV